MDLYSAGEMLPGSGLSTMKEYGSFDVEEVVVVAVVLEGWMVRARK
jgi:hypothetical protein